MVRVIKGIHTTIASARLLYQAGVRDHSIAMVEKVNTQPPTAGLQQTDIGRLLAYMRNGAAVPDRIWRYASDEAKEGNRGKGLAVVNMAKTEIVARRKKAVAEMLKNGLAIDEIVATLVVGSKRFSRRTIERDISEIREKAQKTAEKKV